MYRTAGPLPGMPHWWSLGNPRGSVRGGISPWVTGKWKYSYCLVCAMLTNVSLCPRAGFRRDAGSPGSDSLPEILCTLWAKEPVQIMAERSNNGRPPKHSSYLPHQRG